MRALYLRWVAANALGEGLGLGLTAVASVVLFPALLNAEGVAAWALMAVMVLLGAGIEGVIVGTLQWAVLRGAFPGMRWVVWAGATAFGAGVAWSLGMLPSTLLAAGASSEASTATIAEPPLALVLLLAAGMGLALGPVLGLPQWWVLRRYASRAWVWIPANAAAWAAGIPLVFVGTSAIGPEGIGPSAGLAIGASLLAAGAAVGAVHGLALLRLAPKREAAYA